ncbi:hypothetical protein [Streptomyces sp. ALI-76-A]|uniref:hypothetical protein n=1 Tax=Streptomyces sp. ALI-76-A TaxID=3025736 RepID=UPI00256F4F65|nr:hypothetical protein [Streptomyces sp. ALI-76-A]MDL5200228.1 hypothetical protein [Streptomyces sp. ALI-76-A]
MTRTAPYRVALRGERLLQFAAGGPVHGAAFGGLRHGTGGTADHLRTMVRPACDRPDFGLAFVARLKEFVTRPERDGTAGHRRITA